MQSDPTFETFVARVGWTDNTATLCCYCIIMSSSIRSDRSRQVGNGSDLCVWFVRLPFSSNTTQCCAWSLDETFCYKKDIRPKVNDNEITRGKNFILVKKLEGNAILYVWYHSDILYSIYVITKFLGPTKGLTSTPLGFWWQQSRRGVPSETGPTRTATKWYQKWGCLFEERQPY